jgi:hypothetical protein
MDKLVAFDTIMCYLPEMKDRALADAVDTIRKELVEVQNPSHNKQSTPCSACVDDFKDRNFQFSYCPGCGRKL